jgi:Cu-processing system ATP-binding protein
MAELFETHRLDKAYGKKPVLKELSLSVGEGHCVALLGHNGAGKTTLMKLLLGLTAPTAGHVRLFGRDPRGKHGEELRRAVGYLPENVSFQAGMTGRELLRFYAGLKRAEAGQCDELLAEVRLAEAADRRLRTYSKGMRQRLGLAQALLGRPRLLLLDEPTNGLDPPLRRQFYDVVQSLTRKGATALVSSHVLTEIEARADLIAILRDGELAAFGPLGDLREASRLPFRLRLKVKPDTIGGVAEAIGRDFTLDRMEDGIADFVCDSRDKMAIVRRLAKLNGEVRDIDILPPGLEEIYAHYVGGGRPL